MKVNIPSQLQIYITHNATAIRNTIEYFQKHLDDIRCEIECNIQPPVEIENFNTITGQVEIDVSIDNVDTTFIDEMLAVFYKTLHVKIDSFAETGLRKLKELVESQKENYNKKKEESTIEYYYNYINSKFQFDFPNIAKKWKNFYDFHQRCNENKHEDEIVIEDFNGYSKYLLDNLSEVEKMLLDIEKSTKEKLSINRKRNIYKPNSNE